MTLSPKFIAGIFVGIDSGSLDSIYMSGSVKGNVYGLVGEYVAGEERKLSMTGSLSPSNFISDGPRLTAGSQVRSRLEAVRELRHQVVVHNASFGCDS